MILSIHISINNFDELKDFNETINYYFKGEIKIKNYVYNLSGLVLNKSINHYICLFKNNNINLLINNNNNNVWFLYDDCTGYIEKLDQNNIGYKNLRNLYGNSLLIYTKS